MCLVGESARGMVGENAQLTLDRALDVLGALECGGPG